MMVGFREIALDAPIHSGLAIIVVAGAPAPNGIGTFAGVAVHHVRVIFLVLAAHAGHASNAGLFAGTKTSAPASLVDVDWVIESVCENMHEGRSVAFGRVFPVGIDCSKRSVI